MQDSFFDVIILGSGPAGCSAGIYAARADLRVLMLCGADPGGQLSITTDVENYPGFEKIQGPELMKRMRSHAETCGVVTVDDYADSVKLSGDIKECILKSGNSFRASVIIIATGASAKWLNIPGEDKYRGYGVSGCAVCDAFFFKNREVAVIGGGNTAVEEALYLSQHVSKVLLIHRREALRAEPILQKRLFANSKIECMWNTVVVNILGTDDPMKQVTGLTISTNGVESHIDIEGVFVAIGHKPNTDIFLSNPDFEVNEFGYAKTLASNSTAIKIPGIFVAGDVADDKYRQAVTAAGSGCMAALDAWKFISERKEIG